MAQEEIEIEISPAGTVTIRTVGIKGPKCADAAEAVARIIGRIDSSVRTSEYYEGQSQNHESIDVNLRR